MGGLLEGVKGHRPVNERNIERILDRSLHLTDSLLQLLLASKDDLKRLCGVGAGTTTTGGGGGGSVEAISVERLAKHANNKKLMEIVDKINKAYVEYHRTIDDLTELGKVAEGEEEEEEEEYDEVENEEDEEDEDDDEYHNSKSKYRRYDNGDEVVKKRPYNRRQPYHRRQVKTEHLGYHGNTAHHHGTAAVGNQGDSSFDHHHDNNNNNNNNSDNNNYFNNNNNSNNRARDQELGLENAPWQIKKEKPWDWSEEDKGHDLDPNVSNDLVMTCEPGSDDETLYNVGFPKFSRNY